MAIRRAVASKETLGESAAWWRHEAWHILSTAFIITLLLVFVYNHATAWVSTGRVNNLIFAAQETVLVILFLIRRRPIDSTGNPWFWTVAFIGGFGPLLMRPGGATLFGIEPVYIGLQAVGAGLALIGSLYLGRSFGIIPANRGIKTSGLYRIVRHPMYAAYLLVVIGFVLSAFSLLNVVILAACLIAQVFRIFAEEEFLMQDAAYRDYAQRTRYRLVPYVF